MRQDSSLADCKGLVPLRHQPELGEAYSQSSPHLSSFLTRNNPEHFNSFHAVVHNLGLSLVIDIILLDLLRVIAINHNGFRRPPGLSGDARRFTLWSETHIRLALTVVERFQPELQPSQAVNILNDRVTQIGSINNAIASWLQVRSSRAAGAYPS